MIDIEKVEKIIGSGNDLNFDFGGYSKIYMHTTENIKDFLTCFDTHGSKVLTVAGSGDQLLNAYALGASSVDIFDINPLAKCGVDLKVSAVKSLSYEDFIHFFFSKYPSYFSLDLYSKIYPYLTSETKLLFDALFRRFGIKNSVKKLYYQWNPTLEKMKQMNIYLEEYYYYALKEALKNKSFKFLESPLQELKENIDSSYDMMMFSNITDSLNRIYGENALKEYLRLIHSMTKKLNKGGSIEVGYIYGSYSKGEVISDFVSDEKRQKIFKPDVFSDLKVNPYIDSIYRDQIVYYTKKK